MNLKQLHESLLIREAVKGTDISSFIRKIKDERVLKYIIDEGLDIFQFSDEDSWINKQFNVTCQECFILIRQGLLRDLDIKQFAKPCYNRRQMYEIKHGLEKGVDVSIYADARFESGQMAEIKEGLMDGIDVSVYAKESFNDYQMCEIRDGLRNGIDVSSYAKEEIDFIDMRLIKQVLIKKLYK